MRLYTASSEETLRASKLLKDWAGEDYLSKEQYEHLKQETVSELRTTNIFLRLVLFLFTLIIVAAATALFLEGLRSHPSEQTAGIFLLIFAVAAYAVAEVAVSQARLYRYGIEEALAACSVAFLCVGMQFALFSGHPLLPASDTAHSLVPAAGAAFSLWIWYRFGLWYAFAAAMVFAVFIPGYWTSSRAPQHMIVVAFYVVALIVVTALRARHRYDYLEGTYSLAEAFLWLGIYLAINLKLSPLDLPGQWWGSSTYAASEFPRTFYWTTWVLIWCLPPVILARGVRLKDRFVIAVGTIAAILTFVSNKPYLGWQRNTWDPMLLGILLIGVVLFLRRWLVQGPDGVRHGFTAARLSGEDKRWMNVGSAALGLVSPQAVTPEPQPSSPDFHFGGGASGGGGAGGDF